jgi:peptidoglycan/xylan/chitin deacetylase (PgdA/CDA1 family)
MSPKTPHGRSGRQRRCRVAAVSLAVLTSAGAAVAFDVLHAPASKAPTPAAAMGSPSPVTRARPDTLPVPLPNRVLSVPILMYHRVGSVAAREPAITDALTVSPQVFSEQMRWIHGAGFHAITQEQLFAALEYGHRLPGRPIMITFDDGYRDVLWNAAPVLHRLHMPATAYIITDRVSGPDPSFLTWDELRMLEARGIAIGSHTVHHLDLTLMPPAEAYQELVVSRRELERHLGHPVWWFAYPSGRENPEVVALVRRAGYRLAMTTMHGDVQSARHPFLLRRDEVLDTTGLRGLEWLLQRREGRASERDLEAG